MSGYEQIANELQKRIEALVPEHPEILDFDDPWKLFKVPASSAATSGRR